jgi:hypothetical protein
MKKSVQALFTSIILIITTQATAFSYTPGSNLFSSSLAVLKTHNTISSVSLRLHLGQDMHGFVDSKLCSFCKKLRVIITPKTAAYKNDIKVPLAHAKESIGKRATVTYDLKTKNVSAIRW